MIAAGSDYETDKMRPGELKIGILESLGPGICD